MTKLEPDSNANPERILRTNEDSTSEQLDGLKSCLKHTQGLISKYLQTLH